MDEGSDFNFLLTVIHYVPEAVREYSQYNTARITMYGTLEVRILLQFLLRSSDFTFEAS